MNPSAMRPRTVGEVLDAGIKLYLGNARTLMGLAAVVVIPMQILAGVVLLSTIPNGRDIPAGFYSLSHRTSTTTSDALARLGAQGIVTVVSLIVTLLTTAACVKAVSDAYLDQPTNAKVSLRFALRRLPALIGMELLLILGLIGAFIALIIPGIWLYAAWSMAAPALLIERLGPARALGRSRRLVQGRWWATAGILLVATLMVSVVSGALQALLSAVASLPSQPTLLTAVLVATLSGIVSTIVAQPFHAAIATTLYYDLRVRKEGYDLQVLAEQLGLPEVAAAAPAAGEWEVPQTVGPESVGQPGGPPYWPPPADWRPAGPS